ncbi:TPA: LPXTG cell wall anchor domain-containing protein [Streptococcus agalactiae]|nr:LPXTG cell wall anchor domain-containing protein [Streptococcus agalactiae]
MKKWTKLITLSSVAVLASASPLTAFADENAPVTSDVPAVVTTPEVPTDTSSAPSDDTVVPTVPETPTETPSTPEDNTVVPTDPNVTVPSTSEPAETTPSTEVTQPSDTTVTPTDGTTEPTTPTEPTEPSSDGDGTVTVPTVNGGTTTLTPNPSVPTNNPAVSAQTAVNAGASQVGTTSTVTGQVVSNVAPSAPVYTNTGYQIVSTQNGQVVLSDGSTVAPEAIGAVTNTDKTITVTKADGTKATLPETGEAANFLAVVGTGLLGLVGFLFKKKLV